MDRKLTLLIATLLQGILLYAQSGPVGRYLQLNGIDQCMAIPSHPGLNLDPGEDITITVRARSNDLQSQHTLFSKGNVSLPGGRYEMLTYGYEYAPNLSLDLRTNDNKFVGDTEIAEIGRGVWYHLAWVYHAAAQVSYVYVNGREMSHVSHASIGTASISNGLDLLLGSRFQEALIPVKGMHWDGDLDEFRIWSRALNSEEILSDSRSMKPEGYGLAASYDFEGMTETSVPDVTGRGRNGILYGYGSKAVRCLLPTAPGNVQERLMAFRVIGQTPLETIRSVTIDLTGTDVLTDIERLDLWINGSRERFRPEGAKLFASGSPAKRTLILNGSHTLVPGDNYFWLTADLSPGAREGSRISASVTGYTVSDGTRRTVAQSSGSRVVLLGHRLLFTGGDAGSKNYRIPAVAVARDGSIVVAADRRWDGPMDLPAHIDVVVRRSTDKGLTWSDPVTLAGEGTLTGYGDAALGLNRNSGDLLCLFAGQRGFYGSTSADPIRIYLCRSSDHGVTWGAPRDITSQVYGTGCDHPVRQTWQGVFVSSGAIAQLRSGRMMAAISVREKKGTTISNYALWTDDNGRTWQVSPGRASMGGNEASIAELENGTLLMSIRSQGNRLFSWSSDRGNSWSSTVPRYDLIDPSCNGDLSRYTSLADGFDRSRLLHSIPWSLQRENVSVLLSYDEGTSWPVRRTLYAGPSAYSSLCTLRDGTIGLFYEAGEYETYQLYFARFTLEWLTQGADRWTDGHIRHDDDVLPPVAEEEEPRVYPNPASGGTLYVSGLSGPDLPLLIGPDGRNIPFHAEVTGPGSMEIHTAPLQPGFYVLRAGAHALRVVVTQF